MWKDYTREEQADVIMRYVDDIELALVGKEVVVKQINFRESICKPCQELYDNGYIDTTKPMLLGNVLGSVRFSNYLPEEEFGEIIMRLQQYYDVHFAEATYYLQKQMFYFNFAENNSAIVRVFPLEDYYKVENIENIEPYFNAIPDVNDMTVTYKKDEPVEIEVKPVKFSEENKEVSSED